MEAVSFKANKKGWIVYVMIAVALLPLAAGWLAAAQLAAQPFMLLPLLVPIVLLIWSYCTTGYCIAQGKLHYQSAFIKGSININEIKKITVSTTLWTGIKAALASGGIIIFYGRYQQVYIAPESNEAMVQALLKLNPDIEVESSPGMK